MNYVHLVSGSVERVAEMFSVTVDVPEGARSD